MSNTSRLNPKVLTFILDGWGLNKDYEGNAISRANTPTFDSLWANQPHAKLECSGTAVGLPEGQMGTSEVNHMTIGAGRVIYQDLVRINKAIESGDFFKNEEFLNAFKHVKKNNSKLHIKGLYSPGGIHSHQNHIKALVKAAKDHGITDNLYLHLMLDGRDTKPKSALGYVRELQEFLDEIGAGHIASIGGRYYAMDRDTNWDRTDLAFNALTKGEAEATYDTAIQAIEANYDSDITDEFIKPTIIKTKTDNPALIEAGDSVIFANFRSDRPRQLVERFEEKGPDNLYYVTMAQYNPDYSVHVAFPPIDVTMPLGQVLAEAYKKQLRITETEKFAHLTFFMNCKEEEAYSGEERIMLKSNKDVKNHDEKPEMRTPDIATEIIKQLKAEKYDAIFTNLCNADMVGHTGNMKATIKAVDTVDRALAEILPVAQEHGYDVIITADHGNADELMDEDGSRLTAHTTNPVPFILISNDFKELRRDQGSMTDVAPTILSLLGLPKPKQMTGISLV